MLFTHELYDCLVTILLKVQCFDTTFYKSCQQIDFVCQLEVNSSMGGGGERMNGDNK